MTESASRSGPALDEAISASLTLDHVGIAVSDVYASMEHFGALLGVDHWRRSTFRTMALYEGERQVIGGVVATGSLGVINVELVQPTEGSWTPVDVLATTGEGLYHVGYRTSGELSSVVARCADQGIGVALQGLGGNDELLFAYLEAKDMHGVTVELVGNFIRPEGFVLEREDYVIGRGKES